MRYLASPMLVVVGIIHLCHRLAYSGANNSALHGLSFTSLAFPS
jgi:hypothetical protein